MTIFGFSVIWLAVIVLGLIILAFIDNTLVKVAASFGAAYWLVVMGLSIMRSVF